MRRVLLLFLLSLCTINGYSENQIRPHFALFYPVSTNKTRFDSTNVNLAFLQNSLGCVKGVNLCGISAICKSDVTGLQSALLYSQIDENLKGVSFAAVNVVNDSVKGVQVSVAANLLGKSFKGAQSSAIINFVGGNFQGYQQSSVFNIVGKSFVGVQSAGAGNVVGGDFRGIQTGSTFNFVGKLMKGLQWSGVNVCGESRGLQLGWSNITQVNHGWQIGIMNIAEIQNGIPVGLINLSDDRNIQWQNYFSNFAGMISAVRFESNNFVSSLEFGGPNLESGIDESFMVGFHYGYRIPIKRIGLETDFGFFHVIYEPENEESDIPNSLALQLRFSATYQITNWLSIFAGIGGTAMAEYELDEDEETEDRFLYFAGFNLF